MRTELPLFSQKTGEIGDQHFVLKAYNGQPIANRRYRFWSGNGKIEGFTNENGKTEILEGFVGQYAKFEIVKAIYDEYFIVKDPLGSPIENLRYRIRTKSNAELEGVTDSLGRTALLMSDCIESIDLLIINEDEGGDGG